MKGCGMMSRLNKGYTLMEVLMVVAIVGLLSSLVLARFDSERKRTAINVTKANLESIRTAVALFYEIEGTWPANNLSNLINGAPSGKRYLGSMPAEAIKNISVVVNVTNNNGGWVFDLAGHTVLPNLTGLDAKGIAYNTY
jgi:prepilin-type N-terminal cleavage/methylation domain-containing protein